MGYLSPFDHCAELCGWPDGGMSWWRMANICNMGESHHLWLLILYEDLICDHVHLCHVAVVVFVRIKLTCSMNEHMITILGINQLHELH